MDTPNTVPYMIAGYIVFSVVMIIYTTSLIVRFRRKKMELQSLDEVLKK
jgi:hypothetical protein